MKLNKIAFPILLIVFILSLVGLGRKFLEYHQGVSEYEGIKEVCIIKKEKQKIVKEEAEKVYTIDFKKLKSENKDTVGWIKFEEPSKINYPILQGKDNNEYLRRTFYHKYNILGSIFLEEDNTSDFTDKNTIIYGHNIQNGSMFGSLSKYLDGEYLSKHKNFEIYTPDGEKTSYEIFNVAIVKDDSFFYKTKFDSQMEFQEYLLRCCEEGIFETEILADRIITLSTCTNIEEDERIIVQARPIYEA